MFAVSLKRLGSIEVCNFLKNVPIIIYSLDSISLMMPNQYGGNKPFITMSWIASQKVFRIYNRFLIMLYKIKPRTSEAFEATPYISVMGDSRYGMLVYVTFWFVPLHGFYNYIQTQFNTFLRWGLTGFCTFNLRMGISVSYLL